jgi:hypothetical protein
MKVLIDGQQIEGIIHSNIISKVQTNTDCGKDFPSSNSYIIAEKTKKCFVLIATDRSKNIYQLLSVANSNLKNTDGFIIKASTHDFKIELKCNAELKDSTWTYQPNEPTLTVESKYACGSVDQLGKIMNENRIIICVVLVLFGVILLLFGGRKFKWIIAMCGFMIGVFTVAFLFCSFVEINEKPSTVYILIFFAVFVGLIAAYLSYHSVLISLVVAGFATGYLVSNMIIIFMQLKYNDVS